MYLNFKVVPLLLSVALGSALLAISPRPVGATPLPAGEPISAVLSVTAPSGNPGQRTLDHCNCITMHLLVRFKGSNTYVDETNSPNTTYVSSDSSLGSFSSQNVWCNGPHSPKTTAVIYAIYRDLQTGLFVTATVDLKLTGQNGNGGCYDS